jgi:hypothetical protein
VKTIRRDGTKTSDVGNEGHPYHSNPEGTTLRVLPVREQDHGPLAGEILVETRADGDRHRIHMALAGLRTRMNARSGSWPPGRRT